MLRTLAPHPGPCTPARRCSNRCGGLRRPRAAHHRRPRAVISARSSSPIRPTLFILTVRGAGYRFRDVSCRRHAGDSLRLRLVLVLPAVVATAIGVVYLYVVPSLSAEPRRRAAGPAAGSPLEQAKTGAPARLEAANSRPASQPGRDQPAGQGPGERVRGQRRHIEVTTPRSGGRPPQQPGRGAGGRSGSPAAAAAASWWWRSGCPPRRRAGAEPAGEGRRRDGGPGRAADPVRRRAGAACRPLVGWAAAQGVTPG